MLAICLVGSLPLAHGQNQETVDGAARFQAFYDQHPELADFFPFGVYGGPDRLTKLGESAQDNAAFVFDIMTENNLNCTWITINRQLANPLDDRPVLSDFGKWLYGVEYPKYEIKLAPSFTNTGFRFSAAAFQGLQRDKPLLNDDEMRMVEEKLRGRLSFADEFARTYPQTVYAMVTDDEPHFLAPTTAALRLMEKHTKRAATTCLPSWGANMQYSQQMQPFTGDWYLVNYLMRDSWSTAKRLRWLMENRPGTVVWLIPLATGDCLASTLPGFRDSRPTNAEFRLQCWSALGLGVKAFYSFIMMREGFSWTNSDDGMIDMFGQANHITPDQDHLATAKELGGIFTVIGPCLLAAAPVASTDITISCGRVRFPEFEGPAIDCGLLRDARRNLDFIIPWNNDVEKEQQGTLRLPASLVGGRALYDLHDLKAITLEQKDTMSVRLPAGGGRIYLLADSKGFDWCRDSILRHRLTALRVKGRIDIERLSRFASLSKPAQVLTEKFNQAQKLEKDGRWEKSGELYREIAREAQGHLTAMADYCSCSEALGRTVKLLSAGDDLLRTLGWSLFNLPIGDSDWKAHYGVPVIGPRIQEYTTCASLWKQYEMDRLNGRLARADGSSLVAVTRDLENRTVANHQAIQQAIDTRLREARKSLTVAFISMNHTDAEETAVYAWLFRLYNVAWFAPNDKGELVSLDGKAFHAKDFKTVWIHQPRFCQPMEKGKPIAPSAVLMPALTTDVFIDELRTYLNDGGGLLLSGVAGLYAVSLKLETVQPNRVLEQSIYPRHISVGLAPAPGFAGHPALAGVPEEGKLSNGITSGYVVVWECCWENVKPTGRVIANEYKEVYGRSEAVAVMVEYSCGQGKAVVMGGLGCNLNPDTLPGEHSHKVRDRVRATYVNALEYLAGSTRFVVSPEAMKKAMDSVNAKQFLPIHDWQFAIDPKNEGQEKGWFKQEHPVNDWKKIRLDAPWESQGFENYDGVAWYRRSFPAANQPNKRTYLYFHAVDEEAVVYLDGVLIGRHEEGPSGWDKAFRFDITDKLSDKRSEHVLIVRVNDSAAAGGIYKPVALVYE